MQSGDEKPESQGRGRIIDAKVTATQSIGTRQEFEEETGGKKRA
jgi:hypothetical protein